MPSTVLVAYATRYGSTQEIAEAVANALRENGLAVEIQPARDVRSLEGYSGIVLGSPLFIFSLHKDIKRFLSRFKKELSGKPVAVFASGPTPPGKEEDFKAAIEMVDKELGKFTWFKPAAKQVFGGKLDPTRLKFPFSIGMKEMPAGDLRDWDAIRAWAAGLGDTLA